MAMSSPEISGYFAVGDFQLAAGKSLERAFMLVTYAVKKRDSEIVDLCLSMHFLFIQKHNILMPETSLQVSTY
jgi:hypothetical protein